MHQMGGGAGFCFRLGGGSSLAQAAKPGPSAAGVGTNEALGQRAHVTNTAMADPPPHSVAAGPRGARVKLSGRSREEDFANKSKNRFTSCYAESCGRGGVAGGLNLASKKTVAPKLYVFPWEKNLGKK